MTDEVYTCQHGGPGELTAHDKMIFVINYTTNLDNANKELVRSQYEELLATEMVVLEELLKIETLKAMVDDSLVRFYFKMSTDDLLKAEVELAKVNARVGIYLAMVLVHGCDKFFEMTKEPHDIQKVTLKDMYTALGKISVDQGLVMVVDAQTPCNCLEQAFPALKEKKSK